MTDFASRNSLSISTDFNNGGGSGGGEAKDTTASADVSFFDKAAMMIATKFAKDGDDAPHANPTWGSVIKRDKFQDMDLLESGNAREYITEDSLSPTSAKSWTYSTVHRINKTQYKMFWNNDQFLLSAKQHNGMFYISQYEHFGESSADSSSAVPTSHYCAVLKRTTDNSFKLYNCGCEGCDQGFSKYTCSNDHETSSNFGFTEEAGEGADRQLLADISHFTKVVSGISSEMRCLSVVIPAVMEDSRSRVIWCPRMCRSDTPSGGTPRTSAKTELVTSPSPHGKKTKFTFETPVSDRVKLVSKLPSWCSEVNSLIMKFHGGRIREASAKNFMLVLDDDDDKAVFQFGKFSKSKFSLDFRYPLAPIQAFAIGLSSCSWSAKSKLNN
ncbi:hypothetical protein H257_16129 [Aphanomyces astaci]|uniref:Tubby C-terminal domain-containing protein n=1 Tax=Aphanomyces astaci TaxID=112090 RepID=W4FLJ8_APHAT|nr:hypothetical protein H257_16129 [Aphanomyces astaci]ETV67771.1 hypothetical protein H257_16129 [Aphanomyces astaci]|eukprot:XP_009842764.1 hypothetical protein H257_16129 [Aphanomyces astaci]